MTEKQKQKIGKELKDIRLAEGVSLRKLATLMGLNKDNCSSITRIENGIFDTTDLPRRFLEAMGYKLQEKNQYTILKSNKLPLQKPHNNMTKKINAQSMAELHDFSEPYDLFDYLMEMRDSIKCKSIYFGMTAPSQQQFLNYCKDTDEVYNFYAYL